MGDIYLGIVPVGGEGRGGEGRGGEVGDGRGSGQVVCRRRGAPFFFFFAYLSSLTLLSSAPSPFHVLQASVTPST